MMYSRREFVKLGLSLMAIPALSFDGNPTDEIYWDEINKKVSEFKIRWKGKDIKSHPGYRPTNSFEIDTELFNLSVAKDWGLLPSEFDKLNREDKIGVIATYIAVNQMEAIQRWEVSHKRVSEQYKTLRTQNKRVSA